MHRSDEKARPVCSSDVVAMHAVQDMGCLQSAGSKIPAQVRKSKHVLVSDIITQILSHHGETWWKSSKQAPFMPA